MRDSFVFYRSFYEALKEMDKNVQADCLMALAQYALDGDMPGLTPEVRMFMTLAKPQIDANNQKFVNGSKGGRPKRINNQTLGGVPVRIVLVIYCGSNKQGWTGRCSFLET